MGLTNFKIGNLKTLEEWLLWIKATPGFNIRYIIDLTASSRIKFHPAWN